MGKSSQADRAAGQAQLEQSELARQLFRQSDPTRRELFRQSEDFLSGDFDVSASPVFGAGKQTIEDQFGRAREGVIAGTPEGGQLTAALAELEGDRAGSLTQFTGQLAESEKNLAAQLATGGTAGGGAILGSAGQLAQSRAAAEAAENAGKSSGSGQAAGAIAASVISKAASSSSDRRLKRNIRKIGIYGSYNLYAYNYLDGPSGVGVMADEIPERFTITGDDGYLLVDYGVLAGGM